MIVTGFPSPDRPSQGIFNQRAAIQLSKYSDVTVFHLRMWKPGRKLVTKEKDKNYTHITLSAPYIPFFENKFLCSAFSSYDRAALKNCREELLNTVVFHSVGASAAGVLGGTWSERFNKPHVLQIIGTDVNTELPELLHLKCFDKLKNFTNAVGCNSEALKSAYEKLMGGTEIIKVVYRGIDTKKYTPTHGSTRDTVKILFLGGVPFYKSVMKTRNLKGGETLMGAWKNNENSFAEKNAQLIFAGPDSDSPFVKEWVSTLKYPGQVSLMGMLNPAELKAIMEDCDVVLIPSLEEGMPNVLLEAGASGKCVIASDVGGIPELVQNNLNGILISAADEAALSAAMLELLNKRDLITEFGKKIRKTVEDKFDSASFAPSYIELYEKVLKRSNT